MPDRRTLRYADTDAVRADVARLRRGHEKAAGEWTLAQTCWHLNAAVARGIRPPTTLEPTDDQRKMQAWLDGLLATGQMPAKLPAAPSMVPAADVTDAAIDAFLAGLDTVDAYREPHVAFGPFGPVPREKFVGFLLAHAAHHLSHFVPTPSKARPTLRYKDEQAMRADLALLRRGYERSGNWSLPQMAWHLSTAIPRPLQPATAADVDALTDAQRDRQKRWDYYIEHVQPPLGFQAPANLLPPPDAGDAAVDALDALLQDVAAFRGDFIVAAAGAMPIARARGFVLAHGAHHLAYLTPTMTAGNKEAARA